MTTIDGKTSDTTETLAAPPPPPIERLLWVDLETTGLDPEHDKVLEVAAVVTEHAGNDLVEVARFQAVTDGARYRDLWKLHPAVQAMHEKSGLWIESTLRGRPLADVASELYAFIDANAPRAQLAGSTISFDRAFMKKHLPSAHALLHYRNLDVSSLNEMARRWFPAAYATRPNADRPKEAAAHRAMDDILESIATLRHYLAFFTVPSVAQIIPGATL